MLISDLCDYRDGYIDAKGKITVTVKRIKKDKKVTFKGCSI